VASATFWTALWGPIGLILATPLTVCLVVLGRHVERLEFLDVMLGDRPALSPPEIFYQRMLADDPAEAVEKAEQFLKARPLLRRLAIPRTTPRLRPRWKPWTKRSRLSLSSSARGLGLSGGPMRPYCALRDAVRLTRPQPR
jgi:hypothetical protein